MIDVMPIVATLPFLADTRYVIATLDGRELDRRVVSANPPSVTLLSPQTGDALSGLVTLNWDTSDPDGDDVTVSILVSDDAGQNWRTLALDIATSSYIVDMAQLTGGRDLWIKLIATDGIRTGTSISGPYRTLARLRLPLILRNIGSVSEPQTPVPTKTATPTYTNTPSPTPTSTSTPASSCGGPELNSWQTTAALPQALAAPFDGAGRPLVIHQGRAYIFGGKNSTSDRVTTVYMSAIQADGALGGWAEIGALPAQYYDHAEMVIGDYVYLVSGAASAKAVWRSTFAADGTLGSWSKIADLPASRQSFAAVSYGTNIYITGGNSSGTIATVLMGAVRSDGITWQTLPPLPQPTQSHAMLAHNGQLYVLTTSKTVYRAPIYSDGSIGAWTTTTSLPLAMQRFSAVECNGYLYALSDTAGEVYWAPVSADGGLGPWIKTVSLPQARTNLRAGANGCFIYAAGGYDGTNYRNTVYYTRLHPPAQVTGMSGQ